MLSVSDAAPALQANQPATLFRELHSIFQQDALSLQVDVCAANLAAKLASSKGVCVGLIENDALPRYYGLVYVLAHYGVIVRERRRADGQGVFVYLEVAADEPEPSEFEEAKVFGRRVARVELEVAA